MRILLVSPSEPGFVNFSKAKETICVALPLLAAYTPKEHEVMIADEGRGEQVFLDDIDLVGISAMTSQAYQAYRIARYYRERGVKVVLGGIHATVRPEEAASHVDAVCIGEGDEVWPRILQDCAAGRLQNVYRADSLFPMERILPLRLDLVPERHMTFGHTVIQASRGCPYRCDFCTVSSVFGRKYRFRPVDQVIEEVKLRGRKPIVFVDDNIFGSPDYSSELFERLLPLKRRWCGQASLSSLTRDLDLLKLARRSGAGGFLVGLESVNHVSKERSRASAKMGRGELADVSRRIKTILDNGLMIHSTMVLGLDGDDLTVFEKTVDFLKDNHVSFSSFCILTPYPGTEIHSRFKQEGRLIHEDWDKYCNQNVVFYPRRMTPEQLKNGSDWAGRRFYRYSSIIKRFPANWRNAMFYAGMNIYTRKANRNHGGGKIVPMDPVERRKWRNLCVAARSAPA